MNRSSNNNFWKGVGVGILVMPALIFMLFIFWEIGLLNVVKKFFKEWLDVFMGIGYFVVIISFPLALIQIRNAKRDLKANISYQIRRDGREIFTSLTDDIIEYIEGTDINFSTMVETKAKNKIQEMFMYYASIYNQWRNKNFDDSIFREVVLKELCALLKRYRVKTYWEDNIVREGLWSEEFIKMVEKCIQEGENK